MHELLIIEKLVLSINKVEIIYIIFLHKDLLKEQNLQKNPNSVVIYSPSCLYGKVGEVS